MPVILVPFAIAQELADKCQVPVRGVYGNIDGYDVRSVVPEELVFTCEGVKVFMKHIGGYPGRYAPGVKQKLAAEKAQFFISGHSHILKVQFDQSTAMPAHESRGCRENRAGIKCAPSSAS